MEEFTISKKILFAAFAVLLAISFGAYIVYAQPNTTPPASAGVVISAPASGVQEISIKALSNGHYDKEEIIVNQGVPVRLTFTADKNAGCGSILVIYGLNVQVSSQNGQPKVVEFTPEKTGTYQYSCGMRMWGPGKLIVK